MVVWDKKNRGLIVNSNVRYSVKRSFGGFVLKKFIGKELQWTTNSVSSVDRAKNMADYDTRLKKEGGEYVLTKSRRR